MAVNDFLKKAFDSRRASFICVAMAVVNKSLIAWLYSSLKGDKALYLLFTQSFLQTGVMGEPVAVFENGQHVYLYNPAVYSPLYSLICSPVLGLTHSYFIAQYIVSVASFVLFFTALYKVALLFFGHRWQANFFVLCVGFFLYPFELSSPVKDVLAAGFCLWSVVLLHLFYTEKPTWRRTILLALCIGCIGLIKLLYIPVAMMLLILLLVFLVEKRTKVHLLHAALCVALLLFIFSLVWFTVFTPAKGLAGLYPVAIPGDGTAFVLGFFPQNLLLTSPFLTASIFNVNFWGVQAEKLAHLPYPKTIRFFQTADVCLALFLIWYGLAKYKKLWQDKLLLQLVNISIAITGAVLYLSLTQKALSYKSSSQLWAFVSDVRSFFLPMLTLQLLLFRAAFTFSKTVWLWRLLLLLFVLECGHGLYFTVKESIATGLASEATAGNDALKQMVTLLKQDSSRQSRTILVTSDKALKRYAEVHYLPVYSFTDQQADLSWIKKGQRFLIATHRVDSAYLKNFPDGSLIAKDTIEPFVIHTYEGR